MSGILLFMEERSKWLFFFFLRPGKQASKQEKRQGEREKERKKERGRKRERRNEFQCLWQKLGHG